MHPCARNKNSVALGKARDFENWSEKRAIFALDYRVFIALKNKIVGDVVDFGEVYFSSFDGKRDGGHIPWHCDIVRPIDDR